MQVIGHGGPIVNVEVDGETADEAVKESLV
jgi:hypothetical protein